MRSLELKLIIQIEKGQIWEIGGEIIGLLVGVRN